MGSTLRYTVGARIPTTVYLEVTRFVLGIYTSCGLGG